MIYIGWEIFALIFDKTKNNKKILALSLMAALWAFASLRSIDMGINDVQMVYLPQYRKCLSQSFLSVITERGIWNEPLMNSITWILARVFQNFQIYLSIMCLIPLAGWYNFICKYTKRYIQGILIFFSLFYFYHFFLIKQMLAISIVLYAYPYLNQRKLFRYTVIVLFAALVHKSALVMLPAYFLCKLLKFNKHFFTISIIGIFVGLFGSQYILHFLYKLPFYRFESYIYHGIYATDGNINFSMFLYIAFSFFCYFVLQKRNGETENDFLILMFIGSVLNCWSVIVVEFYRIAFYFMCVSCIMIPEALYQFPQKHKKIITVLALIMFCGYAFKIARNCNCLPYISFWGD